MSWPPNFAAHGPFKPLLPKHLKGLNKAKLYGVPPAVPHDTRTR
jgi:hypothetical protein